MKKMLHLQALTHKTVRDVTESTRAAMSRYCGGIDDMHQLGSNALVVRAEIFPAKLPGLYEALQSIDLELLADSLPDASSLQGATEYSITLQVRSISGDTDGRVEIPMVPG